MKQTAIEFFMEKIPYRIGELYKQEFAEIYEQAKAMERQQIIDAYNFGQIDATPPLIECNGEQYFTETYGEDKKQD